MNGSVPKGADLFERKKMTLDDLIKVAADGYTVVDLFDEMWDAEAQDIKTGAGDTLGEFIVSELYETYDATATTEQQLEEATRVMTAAEGDLRGVIESLESRLNGD